MAWFGSKATTGLCQPLIAMMPPHDIYIETHLGGGAIMQAQATRAQEHRHRSGRTGDRGLQLRLPGRAGPRVRTPVSGRVSL